MCRHTMCQDLPASDAFVRTDDVQLCRFPGNAKVRFQPSGDGMLRPGEPVLFIGNRQKKNVHLRLLPTFSIRTEHVQKRGQRSFGVTRAPAVQSSLADHRAKRVNRHPVGKDRVQMGFQKKRLAGTHIQPCNDIWPTRRHFIDFHIHRSVPQIVCHKLRQSPLTILAPFPATSHGIDAGNANEV